MPGRSQLYAAGLALLAGLQAVLLYFHLSDFFHVLATVCLVALGVRLGPGRSALLLVSIALSIGGIEIVHSIVGGNKFHNGHDRLTVGVRYMRNRELELAMPIGNLAAAGDQQDGPSSDTRRVYWKTDSRGYRNSQELALPELMVVGDSFVVGVGSTQEESLPEQLNERLGIPTRSLSHPGDMKKYVAAIDANRDLLEHDPLVFVFVFEGNDFCEEKKRDFWDFTQKRARFRRPITSFYRSRFSSMGWLKQLIAAVFGQDRGDRVRFVEAEGRRLWLFREYDEVTVRTEYHPRKKAEDALARLLEIADVVFFIPTKARVYQSWIGDPAMPNAQWRWFEAMSQKARVRAVDLTPALRRRAEELLPRGELVFWPDDTHWNGHGMAVAADAAAAEYRRIRGS